VTVGERDRYSRIYELAEPYWQTRSNEIHVPESYVLAQELLTACPGADPDIVLPAVLLHDVGYMAVPSDDHLKGLAGAIKGWEPDITRRHEIQGAALAGEILAEVGWDPARTRAIQDIVDGHDSRREAVSLEDELVKDADKLWRYTESAVRICHEWMHLTTDAYMDWVESEIENWLFTEPAREIARREIATSRGALAADPVP
jgi:hypothetical protein